MQILKDVASATQFVISQKLTGRSVGLVPTMGALHKGHLNLMHQCVSETDMGIASIFVNPTQFNNANDLAKYPRTLELDLELLKETGCAAVFCPTAEEMYKTTPLVSLDFGALGNVLEGKFRPGHFSGVGLIVGKLFNILQPDVAYFGLKDFQQYLVVSQLVRDLHYPVKLVGCEIVREPDGLAMSSRNQRLSQDERSRAALLHQILQQTKAELNLKTWAELKLNAESLCAQSNIRLEYLELAHRETLEIFSLYDNTSPSVLLMAAYVGEVRLIDNVIV